MNSDDNPARRSYGGGWGSRHAAATDEDAPPPPLPPGPGHGHRQDGSPPAWLVIVGTLVLSALVTAVCLAVVGVAFPAAQGGDRGGDPAAVTVPATSTQPAPAAGAAPAGARVVVRLRGSGQLVPTQLGADGRAVVDLGQNEVDQICWVQDPAPSSCQNDQARVPFTVSYQGNG